MFNFVSILKRLLQERSGARKTVHLLVRHLWNSTTRPPSPRVASFKLYHLQSMPEVK